MKEVQVQESSSRSNRTLMQNEFDSCTCASFNKKYWNHFQIRKTKILYSGFELQNSFTFATAI